MSHLLGKIVSEFLSNQILLTLFKTKRHSFRTIQRQSSAPSFVIAEWESGKR